MFRGAIADTPTETLFETIDKVKPMAERANSRLAPIFENRTLRIVSLLISVAAGLSMLFVLFLAYPANAKAEGAHYGKLLVALLITMIISASVSRPDDPW